MEENSARSQENEGLLDAGTAAKLQGQQNGSGRNGFLWLGGSLGCCCFCFWCFCWYSTFIVLGVTFTWYNYWILQVQYLLAGKANEAKLTEFYDSLTEQGNPLVAHYGPETTMYYGWHDVKANLESWGPDLVNGSMTRENELGITFQNSLMFPETGKIALAYDREQHAYVRPLLGNALDKARADDRDCDGSTCWNSKWLRSAFRALLEDRDSFSNQDLTWMVSVVLHKVLLNYDISDEEAQDFASWMNVNLIYQSFPRSLFDMPFMRSVPPFSSALNQRQVFWERVKKAAEAKWPDIAKDEERCTLLVSALIDALALAGGLSLPTVLNYMISLLFMADSPADLSYDGLVENPGRLFNFMMETMRRYPPVGGVPRWVLQGGSWKHQIPNVGQALHDPNVFPDPLKFESGRPGLNQDNMTLSMGWADFALVDGDVSNGDSHSCPGKFLSVQMIMAFMKELLATGPWGIVDPAVEINMYSTSGFVLQKTHQVAKARNGTGSKSNASSSGNVTS